MHNFHKSLLQGDRLSNNLRGETKSSLIESIIQNLNNILNTKKTKQDDFEGRPLLKKSLFNLGIEDFSHLNFSDNQDQETIRTFIIETITQFEPRLQDIEIKFLPQPGAISSIQIVITGSIAGSKSQIDWVTFYGQLNILTGHMPVKN